MPQNDVLDAPKLNGPNFHFDQRWEREYIAFQKLLPELLKTDRNRFAAIYDGAVAAVSDSFEDAAIQAYSKYGYVPLHVGKITNVASAPVRIPSTRIAGLGVAS